MTDYAGLVSALYDALGTWPAVAQACGRDHRRHSAGYYWKIARGDIAKPSDDARIGIGAAATRVLGASSPAVKRATARDTRPSVHPLIADHAAGNNERGRLDIGWPEMIHLWREAYEREAME